MKKIRLLPALSALLITLSFISCGGGESQITTTDGTKKEEDPASEFLNLSECAVIYGASDPSASASSAKKIKAQMLSKTEIWTTCSDDRSDPVEYEILVGNTNRPESAEASQQLSGSGHTFAIMRMGGKIAIVGSDEDAIIRGCQYFTNNLLPSDGGTVIPVKEDFCYMDHFDTDTLWNSSLGGFEILQNTVVYGPTLSHQAPELTYSRIIELSHNGEQNGTLIATAESLDVTCYQIHRSVDGGKSWEKVGEVRSAIAGMIANWQPMLYELPCQVGDLPEGTILLAGCTRNSATTHTEMTLYASRDLGESWKVVSTVAVGGGFDPNGGLSTGLWEPFLLCDDDGKLYCFYSDETDSTAHSQMIVCRSSTDGVNWSETQRIVACTEQYLRPGMPTVTRLGNGKYFITYEMVGQSGNPVYYKVTDDLSDWGNPSDIGTAIVAAGNVSIGSAPYCCWIPAGGDKGTLIVTAKNMVSGSSDTGTDWLVSYDYGKTWVSMDNPLPYTVTDQFRYAYSPCIFAGSDGQTLYYVNNVNSEKVPIKADIRLAVLSVHGFGSAKS